MAAGALLFPLPMGPAAVICTLTALIAGRGQRGPVILGFIALALGAGGLIAGFLIGTAVVGMA